MYKTTKTEFKFSNNRELRKMLKRGDIPEIARMSGYSISTVRNVLGGYQDNSEIIAWTHRLINDRDERLKLIANNHLKDKQ